MHSRLTYRFVIFLMLFLAAVDVAMAGDNAPLSVSCSIPVVPGLNAPPFNTKTAETNVEAQQNEDQSQQEIILAEETAPSTVRQTIYLR